MGLAITGEIVFLLLAVLGAVGGLWWRIEARLSNQDDARTMLQRELAEYKLYVAQNHVSAQVLRETEQRLLVAIDRLADRLDNIAERLERASRKGDF